MSAVPTLLERALRKEQATPRCAYCHSPEYLLGIPLEVDHIMPQSPGGLTELANLCLACRSCNGYKSDKRTGATRKRFRERRFSTHAANHGRAIFVGAKMERASSDSQPQAAPPLPLCK